MKFIYRLPLIIRETHTSSLCRKQKVMEVDGVGFFVKYKDDEDIEPKEKMRKFLMGRRSTSCLVIEEHVDKAVERFYNEWKGAKVGGDEKVEQKALWIDKSRPIVKYPPCDLMTILEKDGDVKFLCGELDEDDGDCGEFGKCCLEGYECFRIQDEETKSHYSLEQKMLASFNSENLISNTPKFAEVINYKGQLFVYPKAYPDYFETFKPTFLHV